MGYWVNGKQHGLGVYVTKTDDREKRGLWENGKRIEWFTDDACDKIQKRQMSYIQYFKDWTNSKIGLPDDCTFQQPNDF